jgi:hypothetical protein
MLAHTALLIAALAGDPGPLKQDGGAPPVPPDAAQREYEERRVGFDLLPYVSGSDGNVTTSLMTVPYQGQYKRPLIGVEFYQVVGREDLAAEYRSRSSRRNVLMGIGIGVIVGGGLYVLSAPRPDVNSSFEEFSRQARARDDAVATGMAIGLGGLGLVTIGALTDPNPVDAVEARRLADEYNRRLKAGLGISGRAPLEPGPEGQAERPRVSFGAGPVPGGAVAGLAVAF